MPKVLLKFLLVFQDGVVLFDIVLDKLLISHLEKIPFKLLLRLHCLE